MSPTRKPRIGFFPFAGGGFETFIRRDLIIRVRFWHPRSFTSSKREQPINNNSAAIVDSFLTIVEVCAFGPANQQEMSGHNQAVGV